MAGDSRRFWRALAVSQLRGASRWEACQNCRAQGIWLSVLQLQGSPPISVDEMQFYYFTHPYLMWHPYFQGTFSVVLMAVVDSRYRFILIDVGAEGRQSDSGVLKASPIGHHLEAGTLGIPGLGRLPRSDLVAPHVFIGDEAFQLRPDFLRPYPGLNLPVEKRVFNLRLSRAR